MRLEIQVTRDRCRATGQCVHIAPGVFAQDEQGISTVIDPRGDPIPTIIEAINCCIPGALTLKIDDVGVDTWLAAVWQRSFPADSPVFSVLASMNTEHEDLKQALDALLRATSEGDAGADGAAGSAGDPLNLLKQITDHLSLEERVAFQRMEQLVDPHLVDAFRRGHVETVRYLQSASAALRDPAETATAVKEVAAVLTEQIGFEEEILFPVVLGALAELEERR